MADRKDSDDNLFKPIWADKLVETVRPFIKQAEQYSKIITPELTRALRHHGELVKGFDKPPEERKPIISRPVANQRIDEEIIRKAVRQEMVKARRRDIARQATLGVIKSMPEELHGGTSQTIKPTGKPRKKLKPYLNSGSVLRDLIYEICNDQKVRFFDEMSAKLAWSLIPGLKSKLVINIGPQKFELADGTKGRYENFSEAYRKQFS